MIRKNNDENIFKKITTMSVSVNYFDMFNL